MALDEALLESVAKGASPPVLRFYRWQPATVSLGYAQSVAADIDLSVCRQAGLDVVRRSTGGRAVLHDEEVTYAVIAPTDGPFGTSVLDCYRVISEVLQQTLQRFGLPAQLVPGRPRGGQMNAAKAVCFSAPSQFELVVDGRKVAGSAQKRHGQAFLQHGSIPIEMDLDLLARVLKTEANMETAGSLDNVGWLNKWADPRLTVADVEQQMINVFASHLGVQWSVGNPTADEMALAEKLCTEKYARASWNMMR